MTVAAHPASQRRFVSLPAARRTRTAMSSQPRQSLSGAAPTPAARICTSNKLVMSFRSTQSSTPAATPALRPRPANPHRSRPPRALPPRGFLLGRLSDAGPAPRLDLKGPASETLPVNRTLRIPTVDASIGRKARV